MSFIRQDLMLGESLVCKGRQAINKFLPKFPMSLFVCLGYFYFDQPIKQAFVAVGFTSFILFCLHFGSMEFGISDRRVIVKKGLFSTTSIELALNVIESVKIKQSFIDRTFNVVDITIVRMGSSPESIHSVKRPIKFKEDFCKQKRHFMLAPNTPANPA